MVAGGVAIAVGRGAMEDFLARAAGDVAGETFAATPSVKALAERLGEGEDLVAFCDLEALFAKFSDRMREEDRRRLEASGVARASIGYGLKVSTPIGRVRPGGVKEALVLSTGKLEGAAELLDLPPLTVAEMNGMARDILGLRLAFDASAFVKRLEKVARSMGGDVVAAKIDAGVEIACARFGMDRDDLLDTLSGRLSLGAASSGGRLLPDVTFVFDSDRPDGLGVLVEAAFPALVAQRGRTIEFEGRTIYAADPQGRDVPALVSPCVALDGVALRGALSTQSLKRAIRGDADDAREPHSKGVAGAVMELSPGPSLVVAADLPRIASIIFEIASIVPEKHGRRMRQLVDDLPPIEDLLDEVCGMAVALYSTGDSVAVESFSPVGQLPAFLGLAIAASRDGGKDTAPEPEGRVPPWDEPPVF